MYVCVCKGTIIMLFSRHYYYYYYYFTYFSGYFVIELKFTLFICVVLPCVCVCVCVCRQTIV